MLAQATPAFGDVEHGGAAPSPQPCPADKNGGSQRGGPLEAPFGSFLVAIALEHGAVRGRRVYKNFASFGEGV